MEVTSTSLAPPRESYSRLFLRFLRFGSLAWGGPVAQIAMIRQELVEEEHWISRDRFNRVLAVYQILPGRKPMVCLLWHVVSRSVGRHTGGLGFMLPGFVLMFLLSWFYVAYGIHSPLFAAVFQGMQPAVAALIVRAIHRIGGHALHQDHWLWGIALGAALAQLLAINFFLTLVVAGAIYTLAKRKQTAFALVVGAIFLVGIALLTPGLIREEASVALTTPTDSPPSVLTLFVSGLRAGLLTFGGAYTVIPFLQHDAVVVGQWMTNEQFLDGLALSGILPAPLIIFATFVGYLGGGPLGALVLTLGIFAPAFAFTLIGHEYLERLMENQALHAFLDGVTAGVVGLIGATALTILNDTVVGLPSWIIFTLALLTLFQWKAKTAVAWVVLGAGLLGWLLFQG